MAKIKPLRKPRRKVTSTPQLKRRKPDASKYVFTISVAFGAGKRFRWRDWGYYFDEASARAVIEQNKTDISERDYYHYGLLAKKGEGPLAIPEVIQWYEFIWKGNKFICADKIGCPEQYRHFGWTTKEG
jgi:hypothetical protein